MDTNASAKHGSDQILDYYCFTCHDNQTDIEAHFYCQLCNKFFCEECDKLHRQLYKKHEVVGRENLDKWQQGQTAERLEQCKEHRDMKVQLYCEDHSQLCCYQCQFNYHRHCGKIELIAELSKGFNKTTNSQRIISDIKDQQGKFDQLHDELENNIRILENSHCEAGKEIQAVRQKIVNCFDELEKKATDDLAKCRDDSRLAFQLDIDKCTTLVEELKYLAAAAETMADKSETLNFVLHKKYIEITESFKDCRRQGNVIRFLVNPCIDEFVSRITNMGTFASVDNANTKIAVVRNQTSYKVQIASDTLQCYITGFNEISGGYIVLSDRNNKRVKLLNNEYNVVSHLDFPGMVWDLCGISKHEIAVTTDDDKVHEVNFVRVANEKITIFKTLKFQHPCIGITYGRFSSTMYLTSGNELYQYTIDGQLIKMLYEGTSNKNSVYKCATSPDEELIYVSNYPDNKIVSLTKEGNVVSMFKSPLCQYPTGVHVTEKGQVLCCSFGGDAVFQLNGEGKELLSTVIGSEHGISKPGSVFYSSKKHVIIVGQLSNDISVFKTQ